MNNLECATLLLSTGSGTTNTLNTSCTWNNINIRTLLGPMYDKYDEFNICLNQISQATAASAANLGNDPNCLNVNIVLSGLPFVNGSYNVATGHNVVSANALCTYTFLPLNINTVSYYSSVQRTFSKNIDVLSLTISLQKYDFSTPATTLAYPNMTYYFTIFGIDKQPNNKNGMKILFN
jgi:hypothetical protein